MAQPSVLVFAGSIRTGSLNARLAAAAARQIALAGAHVDLVSLADYPLPIYDGDLEAEKGLPDNAVKLKRQIGEHDGLFIATPEYNASLPPLLKNAIDWTSRPQPGAPQPYKGRPVALGAASDGALGGYRALIALRQSLELGLSALVMPEMVSVPGASKAFGEDGDLAAERPAAMLKACAEALVQRTRRLG